MEAGWRREGRQWGGRRARRPTPARASSQIVSLATATVDLTLAGDGEPITALAAGPAGGRVYAASRSMTLRAWAVPARGAGVGGADASSSRPLPPLRAWKAHSAPVACLAVDPSGGLLASAGGDGVARVWDADAFHATHALKGHAGPVTAVSFHPATPTLFTGGQDGGVRVWCLASRACVAVLKGHAGAVAACVPAPGPAPPSLPGARLLTVGRDGLAALWDWGGKAKLAEVAVMDAVEGAALVARGASAPASAPADEILFATAGAKGFISVWSTSTRREVARAAAPGAGGAGGGLVALAPLAAPGARLLAASADGRLVEVEIDARNDSKGSMAASVVRHVVGDLDEITDARFLGGAPAPGPAWRPPTHVAVATNAAEVRVVDVGSRATVASLGGHEGAVLALAATTVPSPSTAHASDPVWLLASGGRDGSVCVWAPLAAAAAGGARAAPPAARARAAHEGAATAVAWSKKARGGFLVTGGDDRMVRVWDMRGVLAALVAGGGGGGGGGGDAAPPPPPAPRPAAATVAHDKAVNAVDVSPDDALAATAGADRTARLWSLPDLVPGAVLRGHKRGVWDVKFSPASRTVATASGDATVRVWTVPDGACARALDGHGASVLRCAWAAGGSILATVGADGLLKTWSARTGECGGTEDAHGAKAWALDSADAGGGGGGAGAAGSHHPPSPGREAVLVTGGADGRLVLWRDRGAADAADAASSAAADAAGAQALQNALASGDVRGAASLALKLKAPARLLAAVQGAAAADAGDAARPGAAALRAALRAAAPDGGLVVALEAVRAWVARARTCHEGVALLAAATAEFSPAALLAAPGAASILEAVAAYTARHARRAERLLEATYVVDAALAEAGALSEEEEERGGDAAADARLAGEECGAAGAPEPEPAAADGDADMAAASSDGGGPAPAPPRARRAAVPKRAAKAAAPAPKKAKAGAPAAAAGRRATRTRGAA